MFRLSVFALFNFVLSFISCIFFLLYFLHCFYFFFFIFFIFLFLFFLFLFLFCLFFLFSYISIITWLIIDVIIPPLNTATVAEKPAPWWSTAARKSSCASSPHCSVQTCSPTAPAHHGSPQATRSLWLWRRAMPRSWCIWTRHWTC